jgi:hypothetical protein
MTKEKDFNYYLQLDGGIIFNVAIYNRFSSIGDSCYADICGGFIEGVYQWADHNIESVDDVANAKYQGWVITFNGGVVRRVYIPIWVMEIKPTDFKHAKNLFSKYLLEDVKFNNSEEANMYANLY